MRRRRGVLTPRARRPAGTNPPQNSSSRAATRGRSSEDGIMARSIWKGPFVDGYLLKKAEASRSSGRHEMIRIWSRRSTILPQFVGLTFGVYNGHKHNLVAQLIRGKKVATALADLEFSRKRIARDVRKCLESAIANAENNHDLDVDDLVVAEAHVGRAIVIKSFHPRGRGRIGRIPQPFANLTIVS